MKIKSLLFMALMVSSFTFNAQTYEFSYTTSTYENLVGSTSLNNGMVWDDPQMEIPIGFSFEFFDETINTIYINSFGLGAVLTPQPNDNGITSFLIVEATDIADRGYVGDMVSLSSISYKLEGNEGSQILKIEWNNVGFLNEMDLTDSSTSYANFQLWLHESTNTIEIHHGPISVEQPQVVYDYNPGPSIGLMDQYNIDNDELLGEAFILTGPSESPVVADIVPIEELPSLDGIVEEGTVYVFSKIISSIEEDNGLNSHISLYPNPTNNFVNIGISENQIILEQASVFNTLGEEVMTVNDFSNSIDISDLVAGIYFVEIITNHGTLTKKLTKQ